MIPLLWLVILLASGRASAIPIEGSSNLSLTLPEGFELVSETAPDDSGLTARRFVLKGSNADESPAYFTLQRFPEGGHDAPTALWGQTSDTAKITGRYSERLYNLDVEILDAEWQTNNTTMRGRRVQIPTRADLFLLDLSVAGPQTNELETIMKEVVKSLASQTPARPAEEVRGSISALTYLVMVAIVILVAIARR